ncbi:VOC family protein [Sporosarcina luteola]|uniref:VOC family protein n=1 Tax=Sporosarcina luteola TaxID=582850 RepID=UPI00203B6615|nr:VOC family protein [Sporosarcina luteola]MCM3711224.1 VOC family protein [Sporosarcina luteola]
MAVEVYLNFNGNCRQAVEFYAEVFNTEITQIMTFGEAPQSPDYQLPEEAKDLVMHARLNIDGNRVMFSDTFPGSPFVEGNNVSLAFVNKDMDLIKSVFDKLKQGGTVKMDLQETFWSKSYGSLKDRFGIEWQISQED